MGTQGFSVNNATVASVAKNMTDIGNDLTTNAGNIADLEMHATHQSGLGPGDVFGVQIPDAVTLGTKYNNMLNKLAELGTLLGNSLINTANQFETMNSNYTRTDESLV